MRTRLLLILLPALVVLATSACTENDDAPATPPTAAGSKTPPASLQPGVARERANAALMESNDIAAAFDGTAVSATDGAGPSLEFGFCGVSFGGPRTELLAQRAWFGGVLRVSQEVHYDPETSGADIVAGIRKSADQCIEYVDKLNARHRLGPQVDLSGLAGPDASFGVCVETTNVINGMDVTSSECRAYLARDRFVSIVHVTRGSTMDQHSQSLRRVTPTAAAALTNA